VPALKPYRGQANRRACADTAAGARQAQHRDHRGAGCARVKEQILKFGFLPLQNRGVDELKLFVNSEIVRWGKVDKTPASRRRQ